MKSQKSIADAFIIRLGEHVKKYRKKRKLTLEQLGLEIGLTRMQVNRIEKGYNITLKTLMKLSLALNIKPEKLVRFEYRSKKEDLEGLVNSNKANKKRSSK